MTPALVCTVCDWSYMLYLRCLKTNCPETVIILWCEQQAAQWVFRKRSRECCFKSFVLSQWWTADISEFLLCKMLVAEIYLLWMGAKSAYIFFCV